MKALPEGSPREVLVPVSVEQDGRLYILRDDGRYLTDEQQVYENFKNFHREVDPEGYARQHFKGAKVTFAGVDISKFTSYVTVTMPDGSTQTIEFTDKESDDG